MYSPEKMMGSKGPTGLHGPITSTGACFAGRYSPTYRSPEPMARRCMPNPSVSLFHFLLMPIWILINMYEGKDNDYIKLDIIKYKSN